jgi:hypothetical protein
MTTRETMMQLLGKKWNIEFTSTTEEFNGSPGGIWLSAENGEVAKDGRELFDYYSSNYNIYDLGVHADIENWVQQHGWWFEWNDPGTIMLWPND